MGEISKKPNYKLFLSAVAVVVVIVLAAGCLNAGTKTDSNAATGTNLNSGTETVKAENYTLKASVNKDCTITPWVVGVQKGFFNNSGVHFEDIGEIAATQRNNAFVSGQIDVLDADPNDLINLRLAGVPVIAVAQSGDEPKDGNISETHMHWLVLENSAIKSISDLTAAKLGHKPKIAVTALGICADTQNNKWFKDNGISKDDFEYVVIPDPQQEQALRQGLIDVAILHPPFYTAAERHGGVRILTTSQQAFGSAGGNTLLCFTEKFIKEHPDTVRKFIKGYKTTEEWSDNNRAEAGDITAKAIGLDIAAAHYYSSSGAVNETQLQIWIDQLVADGKLQPGQIKPSDLYTKEFQDSW
jgi:ABC-type nitrate/sulfonate/bicarbonate transport system substrate-binding protein